MVYTLVSGTSDRKVVEVQVLSRAPRNYPKKDLCRPFLFCLCILIIMNRPTDSVRIAVFDQANLDRFLVITEADDPGNWKLPGGKFEMGESGIESPVDAAERELQEEIGASGTAIRLRTAATLTNNDGISARYIFSGLADPAIIRPSAEIAEAQWFTAETLPDCKNRSHILAAVAAARQ